VGPAPGEVGYNSVGVVPGNQSELRSSHRTSATSGWMGRQISPASKKGGDLRAVVVASNAVDEVQAGARRRRIDQFVEMGALNDPTPGE